MNLPGDLRQIAQWIHRAEEVLARGLTFDPLTLTPEENISRFSRAYEEHVVRSFYLLIFSHEFFLGDFYG
jgi:hypothetical protein